MQVAENFEKYGKYHPLSMALLMGGVQMGDQVKALEKGVDVLIATPGRLMDLFGRGKIMLNDCKLLVIDEADRMLDMGFIPDIEEICSKLPKRRQTLLFSATMPPPIQKLAAKFLNDPKRVEVARPATANVNIEQRLVEVSADKKKDALRDILRHEEFKNAIIFCNRKTTVRELASSLKRSGFAVGQIQGDMDQVATASPSSTGSRTTRSTSSSRRTSPRAGSTSKASATSSISTCRGSPTITSTASAAPAAPGMTGIAITLATRAGCRGRRRIEKLIGHKIARGRQSGRRRKPRRESENGCRAEAEKRTPGAEPDESSRSAKRAARAEGQRATQQPKHDPVPEPTSRAPAGRRGHQAATGTARCPASFRTAPASLQRLTLESVARRVPSSRRAGATKEPR